MRKIFLAMASMAVAAGLSSVAKAGVDPPSDLGISVSVTPALIPPGGVATVRMTVTNYGPADFVGNGDVYPLTVFTRGFRLDDYWDRGPWEVVQPVTGCYITEDVVGPFIDLSYGLVHTFYLLALPAGASHVCTFNLDFYPTAPEIVDTHWAFSAFINDPNPTNDATSYRFVIGNPPPPVPVPASGPAGKLLLTLGLMALGCGVMTFRTGRRRHGAECSEQ